MFSNFIDIWNLHRSFYTSLSELLSASLSQPQAQPPPLSPALISHFPYLSLYTPFVTTFPTVLSRLAALSVSNATFDTFVKAQESDERCGKLKLRDWLLTIVQRCPRYLLLIKDLIGCTDTEDPEHAHLVAAHALLSKGRKLESHAVVKLIYLLDSNEFPRHFLAYALSNIGTSRATASYPKSSYAIDQSR